MESLSLTVPEVVPQVSNSTYRISRLDLDWDAARITIYLRGANGESRGIEYAGATATTMMQGLNKANLSNQSLHNRVLARLIADGKLTGTIAGSPD